MDAAVGVVTEPVAAAETKVVFDLAGSLDGKRLHEVGTGDGTYAIEAANRVRAASRGVNVTLRQGRAEQLPFDDASFDVVLAATVLCFVPDAEVAVREMARVLEPGACPDSGPRRSRPI